MKTAIFAPKISPFDNCNFTPSQSYNRVVLIQSPLHSSFLIQHSSFSQSLFDKFFWYEYEYSRAISEAYPAVPLRDTEGCGGVSCVPCASCFPSPFQRGEMKKAIFAPKISPFDN